MILTELKHIIDLVENAVETHDINEVEEALDELHQLYIRIEDGEMLSFNEFE